MAWANIRFLRLTKSLLLSVFFFDFVNNLFYLCFTNFCKKFGFKLVSYEV